MSLSSLKKSNSLDKLLGAVKEENAPQEKKSYKDERIWKPVMDKTGNGYAVIRFLPAVEGEDMPWAKVWNHAFQGPTGQWYIENSLTTLGQNDPVSELNSSYWNSGVESDKEIARRQKRKLQYFSNIYVVKDGANPENEGKVFLYRFGKKIFDKIMETMQPAFEDESPVNPFDFWEGANFKSYDELKTRLDMVLAGTTKVGSAAEIMEDAPKAAPVVDTAPAPAPSVTQDDEDDTMDYFQKLAND